MRPAGGSRRFVIGLVAALAALAAFWVGLRGPLVRRAAADWAKARGFEPELERFFCPDAPSCADVARALAKHQARLESRLAALREAVEFDPSPLADPAEAAELPDRYVRLSQALHERLRDFVARDPDAGRVPAVFDPQGRIRRPDHPARVPRLHRQLLMAYQILRAAARHRLDVAEVRAEPRRIDRAAGPRVLDEAAVTVKALGTLDAVAATAHALSLPPAEGQPSRFLSIRRLHMAPAQGQRGRVACEITFVGLRVAPDATAGIGVEKSAGEQ